MARISSSLVNLLALACQVTARPQGLSPFGCQFPAEDYKIRDVSEPYYGASQDVGGHTCTSGPSGGCQITEGREVSFGITQSVEFGLNLGEILGLSAGYGYSWSTETTKSKSHTVVCPPTKSDWKCNVLVEPMVVKTTGQVRRYHTDGCATDTDEYVPFEVVAPYLKQGGVNEEDNESGNYRPCIEACPGTAHSLDCDGAREAIALGVPACQATALAQQSFTPGWCTAHIIQHQRWQSIVGDKFMFDMKVFDGAGKQLYYQQNKETDVNGRISWPVPLPKDLITRAGGGDNDPVAICYGEQCFHCDDHDGGNYACTLGNGKEYGWDNNKREGDFGFSC